MHETPSCRCGYATPAPLPRCLGCGRRFRACDRELASARPAYHPVAVIQPAVAPPPATTGLVPTPAPMTLSDDELRDAIAAW